MAVKFKANILMAHMLCKLQTKCWFWVEHSGESLPFAGDQAETQPKLVTSLPSPVPTPNEPLDSHLDAEARREQYQGPRRLPKTLVLGENDGAKDGDVMVVSSGEAAPPEGPSGVEPIEVDGVDGDATSEKPDPDDAKPPSNPRKVLVKGGNGCQLFSYTPCLLLWDIWEKHVWGKHSLRYSIG